MKKLMLIIVMLALVFEGYTQSSRSRRSNSSSNKQQVERRANTNSQSNRKSTINRSSRSSTRDKISSGQRSSRSSSSSRVRQSSPNRSNPKINRNSSRSNTRINTNRNSNRSGSIKNNDRNTNSRARISGSNNRSVNRSSSDSRVNSRSRINTNDRVNSGSRTSGNDRINSRSRSSSSDSRINSRSRSSSSNPRINSRRRSSSDNSRINSRSRNSSNDSRINSRRSGANDRSSYSRRSGKENYSQSGRKRYDRQSDVNRNSRPRIVRSRGATYRKEVNIVREVRTVHHHHYIHPPRPISYRRVHYVYRVPRRIHFYWSVNIYNDFRIFYPNVIHWHYRVGDRLSTITAYDAMYHIGEVKRVYGEVTETYYSQADDSYYLYIGAHYPYHDFTVVIPGHEYRRYDFPPLRYMEREHIWVMGLITEYDGKPEIIIKRPYQLKVY